MCFRIKTNQHVLCAVAQNWTRNWLRWITTLTSGDCAKSRPGGSWWLSLARNKINKYIFAVNSFRIRFSHRFYVKERKSPEEQLTINEQNYDGNNRTLNVTCFLFSLILCYRIGHRFESFLFFSTMKEPVSIWSLVDIFLFIFQKYI